MVNLNFGNTLTTAIFFNIVPMIIPIKDMNYIHLWIKILFSQEIPNAPLAGRLHHFSTRSKYILNNERLQILILNLPVKPQNPKVTYHSLDQQHLVNQEIQETLKKGAIRKMSDTAGFLSNLFLVGIKNGRNHPANLKILNYFIPCQHFKMEGFHSPRFLFEENHLLCKIDLKDNSVQIYEISIL